MYLNVINTLFNIESYLPHQIVTWEDIFGSKKVNSKLFNAVVILKTLPLLPSYYVSQFSNLPKKWKIRNRILPLDQELKNK